LHGWSKIDAYTGSLLRQVLFKYPDEFTKLVAQWNLDADLWLRRASVVLFTRKVASSGQFNDVALKFCENLVYDQEDLVLKGVGWSLKDMMRNDKERIIEYVIDLRARGVSSVVTLYAIKDLEGDERARVLGKS
jgi:3-methyladenine DNA glycosylase AlkD